MLRIALSTIIVFAFLIRSISAYGQSCGDANGSGGLSISDVVYMFNYIYQAGPAPADFELADFDQHQEWTMADAARILGCTFSDCGPMILDFCPPTQPAWVPAATSGYRIRHTAAFPAHLEHSIVDLALDAPEISGLQLPLRILVGTTTAQIDSVHLPGSGSIFEFAVSHQVSPPTPGVVVLACLPLFNETGPTPLARVFISAPADTASRLINLEFADFVPAQAPSGHDSPITPMIVTWSVPVQPSFFGTCCLVPGDANGDGQLSISDAVYLVSFYFAGGPPPLGCTSLGDADGNGTLSVSDAVRIISHVFSGGPAPVCI